MQIKIFISNEERNFLCVYDLPTKTVFLFHVEG